MKTTYFNLFALIFIFFFACSPSEKIEDNSSTLTSEEKIDYLKNNFNNRLFSFTIPRNSKIRNIEIDESNKNIEINI
ncbi:MAG: hypothetical protein JXA68_11680, partial [Ignavibacteriales bacterium]|nr:hypothetical protein [Ignavibacteriales bacterium]